MQGGCAYGLRSESLCDLVSAQLALHEHDRQRHAVAVGLGLLHLLVQEQHHIVDLVGFRGLLQGLGYIGCGGADLSDLRSITTYVWSTFEVPLALAPASLLLEH